jgi:hypothetical protein
MIEKITHNDKLLAIIIRSDFSKPTIFLLIFPAARVHEASAGGDPPHAQPGPAAITQEVPSSSAAG